MKKTWRNWKRNSQQRQEQQPATAHSYITTAEKETKHTKSEET